VKVEDKIWVVQHEPAFLSADAFQAASGST
jgi:hypothetical protein